ncbi:MAG: Ig-like domain-containing protein [Lachnospiraceae bacterium]|nr:Ig-like domain-containing protein [Lachnospiraceae bacterium]
MKNFFKKLAFVLTLALVVSCLAPAAQKAEAAASWELNKTTVYLYLNQTAEKKNQYDLSFKTKPDNYLSAYSFAWSTADTSIATVVTGGLVTGVSVGKTTVSCVVTEKATGTVVETLKCTVDVRENAATVKVTNPITAATLGQTYKFERTMANKAGVETAEQWKVVTDYTKWLCDPADAVEFAADGTAKFVKPGEVKVWCETYQSASTPATTAKSDVVTVKVADPSVAGATSTIAKKQLTPTEIELTFANAVTDPSAISFAWVLKTLQGEEVEVLLPFTAEAKKDAANVVVLKSYQSFVHGQTYRFTLGNATVDHVASIGKPAFIQVADAVTVSYDEEEQQTTKEGTVTVKVIDATGVDVTSIYLANQDVDASLTIAPQVENDDLYYVYGYEYRNNVLADAIELIDGVDASKVSSIGFTVTYVLNQTDAEPITLTCNGAASVNVTKKYEVLLDAKMPTLVTKASVTNEADLVNKTAAGSITGFKNDKAISLIALGDEKGADPYLIHVLVKDSRGNYGLDQDEKTQYTLSYVAADNDTLLVEEVNFGGSRYACRFVANKETTNSAIVVYAEKAQEAKQAVGVIYVKVDAARKVDRIEPDAKTKSVIDVAPGSGLTTDTASIKFTAKDQYGVAIATDWTLKNTTKATAAVESTTAQQITDGKISNKEGWKNAFFGETNKADFKSNLNGGSKADAASPASASNTSTFTVTFKADQCAPANGSQTYNYEVKGGEKTYGISFTAFQAGTTTSGAAYKTELRTSSSKVELALTWDKDAKVWKYAPQSVTFNLAKSFNGLDYDVTNIDAIASVAAVADKSSRVNTDTTKITDSHNEILAVVPVGSTKVLASVKKGNTEDIKSNANVKLDGGKVVLTLTGVSAANDTIINGADQKVGNLEVTGDTTSAKIATANLVDASKGLGVGRFTVSTKQITTKTDKTSSGVEYTFFEYKDAKDTFVDVTDKRATQMVLTYAGRDKNTVSVATSDTAKDVAGCFKFKLNGADYTIQPNDNVVVHGYMVKDKLYVQSIDIYVSVATDTFYKTSCNVGTYVNVAANN